MICYNQEKYIEKAMSGVLNQDYSGPVELVIGNDRSKDSTHEIITGLLQDYSGPVKIRYSNHTANKGMIENIKWALQQAEGKYIALCEGDDYWTDTLKLQKQIDLMEAVPDCSMSFHNAATINYTEGFTKEFPKIEGREYSIDEAYRSWMIPTASIVFKTEIAPKIITDLDEPRVFNWDIILILNCFKHGKVHGMSDCMSIYLFGEDGLSILRMKDNKINYLKNNIKHNSLLRERFPMIKKEHFDTKFFHMHMELAKLLYGDRKPRFIYHLLKGLGYRPTLLLTPLRKFLHIKK